MKTINKIGLTILGVLLGPIVIIKITLTIYYWNYFLITKIISTTDWDPENLVALAAVATVGAFLVGLCCLMQFCPEEKHD